MSKRKKIIVLAVMLVLLVATAVLNYTIAVGGKLNEEEPVATGNFFTMYRNERIAARNMEIAYLLKIRSFDTSRVRDA